MIPPMTATATTTPATDEPAPMGLDICGGVAGAPKERPTGGNLTYDAKIGIIHGVPLMYFMRSLNDNALFTMEARQEMVDWCNAEVEAGRPLPVQNGHWQESKEDGDGLLFNFWMDGQVPRASWALNPHNLKHTPAGRIWQARHNPRSLMFSVELGNGGYVEESGVEGPVITSISRVKWFSLTKDGGLTQSLAQTGVHQMEIKTPADLRTAYPKVVGVLVAEERAAFTAELDGENGRAESAAALAAVTTERDELAKKVAEADAREAAAARTKAVATEWAELSKDIKFDGLPDNDDVKALKARMVISETEMARLITLDEALATEELTNRATTLTSTVNVALMGVDKKSPAQPAAPAPAPAPADGNGEGRTESATPAKPGRIYNTAAATQKFDLGGGVSW